MWKKIEKPKDVKKIPVGSRICIDGEPTVLTDHYDEDDYGFDFQGDYGWDETFGDSDHEGDHTIEYWVEEDKNPYPSTEVVRGRKDIDEYTQELEQLIWDEFEGVHTTLRIKPEDMRRVFDKWFESKQSPKKTFSCFRYTRVPGPEANNYPSLAWQFHCDGDDMGFTVARCSENDQFSYRTARFILICRFSTNDWYSTERNHELSLVENAIEALSECPGQFERQVVKDYYKLREIIEFGPEIPF